MLSLIIPTRNRSALLEKTLKSLLFQTLSQKYFEVIIVDNGSKDTTADVVNCFKSGILNIHYFFEPKSGLHVGRHKGFFEAKSEILVYADDDIEACPTWLEAIKDAFEQNDVVMVGGKCLPRFEGEPPSWLKTFWSPNSDGERILSHLSLIDLGEEAKPINPYNIFGCNFAIRRSVLLEAGGFHPDAMPQELIRYRGDGESYVSKYVKDNGYKAFYNPLASVYHWVPHNRMTVEYFCRRSYNQGISDSYTAIRQAKGFIAKPGMTSYFSFAGLVSQMFRFLLPLLENLGSLVSEQTLMRRKMQLAYQTGYAYHQKQVWESQELLAWVMKPDYWDC